MRNIAVTKNTPAWRRWWRQGAVVAAVAALAGGACDKVPLTAPSESSIILFANTTSIPLNGTAEISATVTESAGTPVQNGTVVTFFTSLGTIDPPEVRTQNGKATVRLHAGSTSGLATIRATSGGNTTIDPQLSISIGAASAARVELFATPASLPSGGGNVQLFAIAYDGAGNRVPSVQVSFATDMGTLSANAVITDSNGEARTSLVTALAATVTATVAAGGDKTVTASVKVTLRTAPTVSISVGTATPLVGQPVSFTFTVGTAGSTGAAVRSAVVDFGDGGSQTLSTNGITVASHTYTRSGSYTVTATATDAAGETAVATASVVVGGLAPIGVVLSSSGTMTTQSAITFTASVSLPANQQVYVDRYEWFFGDGSSRTTVSASTIQSTTKVYGATGHYVITVRVVTTDGRTASAQIEIILTT